MSDDEGRDDNYNPEDNPAEQQEQTEPSGERTVTTMGVTYVLKQEDQHKTLEEDEEALFTVRAKLYRFSDEEKEWKERGTGEVKFLKHKTNGRIRLLMRRDKTLKICANHLLTRDLELKAHVGSDKAWVYHVAADFSEEEAKPELLAIRFGTVENAQKFKAEFDAGKASNEKLFSSAPSSPEKQ
jgi:Ran-binding protein 1